jgi:peptidyl-Asp metalloendopeptidase
MRQQYIAVYALLLFFLTANTASAQTVQRLEPDPPVVDGHFGWSIALSADNSFLAVGAPTPVINPAPRDGGTVHVYSRTPDGWVLGEIVVGSDIVTGDGFGADVAFLQADGFRYLLAGARDHDAAGRDKGAVYVFQHIGGVWIEIQKLLPPSPNLGEAFGRAIRTDGRRAIIGAHYWNAATGSARGAAYIFRMEMGQLVLEGQLSEPVRGDDFYATTVDISGDFAFVGAYRQANSDGVRRGVVHVYQRNGTDGWSYMQLIEALDADLNARFGVNLAAAQLDVPTLAVGADLQQGQGRVYIYTLAGKLWERQVVLEAPQTPADAWFGNQIAITHDPLDSADGIMVIGARRESQTGKTLSGAVYRFAGSGASWRHTDRIAPEEIGSGHEFGTSIALTGQYIAAGAPRASVAGNTRAGTAYAMPMPEAPPTLLIARDDFGFALTGEAVRISILENDFHRDDRTLSIKNITAPEHGTATIDGHSVLYQPSGSFVGRDRFNYTVQADDGTGAVATVNIHIAGPETRLIVEGMAEEDGKLPEEVRVRHVRIDLDRLFDLPNQKEGVLTLNLFDDVLAIVSPDVIEQWSESEYSWLGKSARQGDQATIEIDKTSGFIFATIWVDRVPYRLEWIGDDWYRLSQIDTSVLQDHPPGADLRPPPDEKGEAAVDASVQNFLSQNAGVSSTTDISYIDLLIVYTAAARERAGSHQKMLAEIRTAVNNTNQSFRDSGIRARVRLAAVSEVWMPDDTTHAQALLSVKDLGNRHGTTINRLRARYGADIVGLVGLYRDNFCGIGFVMETVSEAFRSHAYFTVNQGNCLGANLSFQHEIGHNMGASHDRFVIETIVDKPYNYSYGYVNPADNRKTWDDFWRTTMAYKDSCENCQRISRWSSPDSLFWDNPMGVASGDDAADNVRALNNTAPTVARFMTAIPLVSVRISHNGEPLDRVNISLSTGGIVTEEDEEYWFFAPETPLVITPVRPGYTFYPQSQTLNSVQDGQVVTFTAVTSRLLAVTGWPTYMADPGRSGRIDGPHIRNEEWWQRNVAGMPSSPVVAPDDLLLVGTNAGAVTAIDLNDGSVRWTRGFKPMVVPPVAGGGGTFYVAQADEEGTITAYNYYADAELWDVRLKAPVSIPPLLVGHRLIVGSDRQVLLVSPDNRQTAVSYTRTQDVKGLAGATAGDAFYVAYADRFITRYNLGFVSLRRVRFGTSGQIMPPVVDRAGRVYTAAGGELRAWTATLDPLWTSATEAESFTGMAIGAELLYAVSASGTVFAIDREGAPVWSHDLGVAPGGPPAVTRATSLGVIQMKTDVLYVPGSDGVLYALNTGASVPAEQRLRWSFTVSSAPLTSVAITSKGLFVGSRFSPFGRVTALPAGADHSTAQTIIMIPESSSIPGGAAIIIWQETLGGPLATFNPWPSDGSGCVGGPLIIPNCEYTPGIFGEPSPFVPTASGPMVIGIADASGDLTGIMNGTTSQGLLHSYQSVIEPGEAVTFIVSGLPDEEGYLTNPDGRSTSLAISETNFGTDLQLESGFVGIYTGHFSTDAGAIDVALIGSTSTITFPTLRYGDTSELLRVPADRYDVSFTLAAAGKRLQEMRAEIDLSGESGRLVSLLAGGFVHPEANRNGQPLSILVGAAEPFAVSLEPLAAGVPIALAISRLFPNPASTTVTIHYEIPLPGSVRIEVFDLLGRRVRIVNEQVHQPGQHALELDTIGLPSGAYMMRLSGDGGNAARTFIIAR